MPDSVPLPRKRDVNSSSSTAPPLWSLQAPADAETQRSPSPAPSERTKKFKSLLSDPVPLASKCASRGGTCCRELKGDDERTLISPDIVRDIVIGLSDGLTVPFALTAGLSSIGSSRLVVLGGLAELIAGSISMGLGGFLASKAELDHFRYLKKQTRARVERSCAGEMEREVHGILGAFGIHENLSRLVAENLRTVEYSSSSPPTSPRIEGIDHPHPHSHHLTTNGAASSAGRLGWFKGLFAGKAKEEDREEQEMRWEDEVGMTAFLLKFGEGLEEVPLSRLWISAFTIGLSYFLGGLIPLLPYIWTETAQQGLLVSTILTGLILILFGIFKTHFTGAEGGFLGYAWGAFSTMAVGLLAAGAAFGIVRVLEVHE